MILYCSDEWPNIFEGLWDLHRCVKYTELPQIFQNDVFLCLGLG